MSQKKLNGQWKIRGDLVYMQNANLYKHKIWIKIGLTNTVKASRENKWDNGDKMDTMNDMKFLIQGM
jgi:hypothetical protein